MSNSHSFIDDNASKFQSMKFNRCFDCGWGEKGVHEVGLSFDEARRIIETVSTDAAERWEDSCETYFEYGSGDYYMIADCDFNYDDWEGSQDY